MKLHFVSFIGLAPGAEKQAKYLGDDSLLKARQKGLSDSALKYGDVDYVHLWNRERLIATDYYQCNKLLLDEPVGCGYWAWKPYIILQTLAQTKSDDYVVYCDVGKPTENALTDHGNIITTSLMPLIKWAERNDGLLPGVYLSNHGAAKKWIKRDCFRLMDCDDQSYHEMPTVQAGYTVWKNTPRVIEFLEKWQALNLDSRLISDQANTLGFKNHDSFIRHCHDQATLSLLCEKEKVNVFGDRKYQFWGFRNINYIALEAAYQNAVINNELRLKEINRQNQIIPNYLVKWLELLILKRSEQDFNVALIGHFTDTQKINWQNYLAVANVNYLTLAEFLKRSDGKYDLLIAISLPEPKFNNELLASSYKSLNEGGAMILGPLPKHKSEFEKTARKISEKGDFTDTAMVDEVRKIKHSPKISNSRNPIFVAGKAASGVDIETLCLMVKPSLMLEKNDKEGVLNDQ